MMRERWVMVAVTSIIISGLSGCSVVGNLSHFSWSTPQKLSDTVQGDFVSLDLIVSGTDVYGWFSDWEADRVGILKGTKKGMEKIASIPLGKDEIYRHLISGPDGQLYLFGYNPHTKIIYRTSEDGGKTWSGEIFPVLNIDIYPASKKMTDIYTYDISPLIVNSLPCIFVTSNSLRNEKTGRPTGWNRSYEKSFLS